jgi:TonB family protein
MARMIGLPLVLLTIANSPPTVVIPPPIRVDHAPEFPSAATGNRGLLMWMPGDVRCDGGAKPEVETLRRPYNSLLHSNITAPKPVTLRFAIDETGRTHSIAQVSAPAAYQSDDLGPAVASSRFAPGRAYAGCTVTYSNRLASFDAAPLPELVSYSMNQHSGRLPREAWQRIEGGADCFAKPRAQQLLRAYPDFSKIEGTPGVRDWSLVRFDIDDTGRAVRPVMVTGTSNRELDAASIKAVADSRFTSGARSGCLYPYYRNPTVLAAPPMPAKPVEQDGCERRDAWEVKPVLYYPPAYSRRAIEGWAVIRYDVAPWGAIGNVSVIEAQPSTDFGVHAKRMMESAKARPSEAGVQNCVVHVRYAMGRQSLQDADAPTEVTY